MIGETDRLARPAGARTPGRRQAEAPFRHGNDWWREGIVYQVYPRSYGDTDGDGIGDLRGIIEHLDHLGPDGLGVDGVWLSPIYPSPGKDVGYDVSDHSAVDPLLGTEDDFDRLVREAHARGLRVILDLVMNHTSDQHAWFQASRQSREGPYADFYLWRDPSGRDEEGRPLPPNNWLSFFGGSAWEYEPGRDQFYLHTFLVEQPEVNWRNPAVEEAQLEMVRGWLDRGVDGFRLDVFNIFLKHPEMLSNPELQDVEPGTSAWDRQEHKHDRDQPDFPELIARFRAIVDDEPGRMSVGELFYGGPETSASLADENHLVFDWELVRAPWSAASTVSCSTGAWRSSGRRPGRRSCSRTTISRDRRAASRHRPTSPTPIPSRAPPRPSSSRCAARRSSTTARRSAFATSRSRSTRSSTPRRDGSRKAGSGGTATGVAHRCHGARSRVMASRQAARGSGSATMRTSATWPPRQRIPARSSRRIDG